jgi:hypothetical protein
MNVAELSSDGSSIGPGVLPFGAACSVDHYQRSCRVGVIPASVRCTQVDGIAFQLICCNEIPNALIFGRVAVGIKGIGVQPLSCDLPAMWCVYYMYRVTDVKGWVGAQVASNKAPLPAG